MSIANARLTQDGYIVKALAATNPSAAKPLWFNMNKANRMTAIITATTDATGTTSAISLQQATSNSGASAKALAFTNVDVYSNTINTGNTTVPGVGVTPVPTAVTGNTFNTSNTINTTSMYVLEVVAPQLDVTNQFNYVQVVVGNSANTTIEVTYIGRDPSYAQYTPPTPLL